MYQIRDSKEKRIIARFTKKSDAEEYLRWKLTHIIEEALEENTELSMNNFKERLVITETGK